MEGILLLVALVVLVVILGNAEWFMRERRRRALGVAPWGFKKEPWDDEVEELWRREESQYRQSGIAKTIAVLAVIAAGIWIASQLNVDFPKSPDAPTHPSGPLTNPWFLWDAGVLFLVMWVSLTFRGSMATALILLLLVVAFVPYLNEVKDLPTVRDAWNPNPATYQPESWECDIQRAKHAAQNYPVDPLYRSCFK